MDKALVYYTRNNQGQRNGCIIAAKINGVIAIGCSKCKKQDKFDKVRAKEIAFTRAYKIVKKGTKYEIPHSMIKDFKKMEERAVSYFKDCIHVS